MIHQVANHQSRAQYYNRKRKAHGEHQNASTRKRHNENPPRHHQSQHRYQNQYRHAHQNQERRDQIQPQDHGHQQQQQRNWRSEWSRSDIWESQNQMTSSYRQPFHPVVNYSMPPAQKFMPAVVEQKKNTSSLFNLVKSLKERGFIPCSSSSPLTHSTVNAQPAVRSEADIWGNFTLQNLRIRNTTAIDEILTKRADACSRCCMKLDDSKGQSKEWKQHMDMHFWEAFDDCEAKKRKGAERPSNQPWYTTYWFKAAAETPEIAEVADVIATGSLIKKCSVCCEKFDQYYDGDEDHWFFKSSTMENGQIVHRKCVSNTNTGDGASKI